MKAKNLPKGIHYDPKTKLYSYGIQISTDEAARLDFRSPRIQRRAKDQTLEGAILERAALVRKLDAWREGGEHPFKKIEAPTAAERLTVKTIVDMFVAASQPQSEGAANTKARVAANVTRFLGNRVAEQLTRADLRWFREQRKGEVLMRDGKTKKGRRAGDMTVKGDLTLLRAALNWAKDEDPPLIESHVFDRFGKNAKKALMPPANLSPFDRVTDEEFEAILSKLPEEYHRISRFLLATGMRSHSEAVKLTWDRVLHGGTEVKLIKRKNGKDIIVPLGPGAQRILGKRTNVSDKCFPEIHAKAYGKAWARAAKRAKLKIRLHDLRGEFISRYADAGGTGTELMDFHGWSSLSVVERYLKARKTRALEVLAKMGTA